MAGATVTRFDEKKTAIDPTSSNRLLPLTQGHGPLSNGRCCELSSSVPLAWAGEEGALLSPSFVYLYSPGQMLNMCWCQRVSHCVLGLLRLQDGTPVHICNHSSPSPEPSWAGAGRGLHHPKTPPIPSRHTGLPCSHNLPSHLYLKGVEDKFTSLHEKPSLSLLVSTAHS